LGVGKRLASVAKGAKVADGDLFAVVLPLRGGSRAAAWWWCRHVLPLLASALRALGLAASASLGDGARLMAGVRPRGVDSIRSVVVRAASVLLVAVGTSADDALNELLLVEGGGGGGR
jgi:hypothetical protein